MDTRTISGNLLLDSLPARETQRLLDGARCEELELRRVLFQPGDQLDRVIFPLSGMVSVVTLMSDGAAVEVASIGREGVVGLPAALGRQSQSNAQWISQIPGDAMSVSTHKFREELSRGQILFEHVNQFLVAIFSLAAQNAACNRLHTNEQRCARWLLMTRDRAGYDEFPLTHEFLAQMLGVRRASVTEAALALQRRGGIDYKRRTVCIADAKILEQQACECYGFIASAFRDLYRRD